MWVGVRCFCIVDLELVFLNVLRRGRLGLCELFVILILLNLFLMCRVCLILFGVCSVWWMLEFCVFCSSWVIMLLVFLMVRVMRSVWLVFLLCFLGSWFDV